MLNELEYSRVEIARLLEAGVTNVVPFAAHTRRLTMNELVEVLREQNLCWTVTDSFDHEASYLVRSLEDAIEDDHLREASMVALGISDPTEPTTTRITTVGHLWWQRTIIRHTDLTTESHIDYVIRKVSYRAAARLLRLIVKRYMTLPA